MIMKHKRMHDILCSSGIVSLKYKGEIIGRAIIDEYGVTLCADKYEDELKNAINKPGISGFSIEIEGSNK